MSYKIIDGDSTYPDFGLGPKVASTRPKRWKLVDPVAKEITEFCLSDSMIAWLQASYPKFKTGMLYDYTTTRRQARPLASRLLGEKYIQKVK